jgi:ADP-ribose pyrophosphatase YjhB (NUDIX family)
VSRPPSGVRRWRPALLSALVFPGTGQLANGKRGRALAFAGGSLALLIVFARRVWLEARVRVPDDPEAFLDPGFPFRLADEIQRANGSFFFWITLGLVTAWAGAVVDAWYGARGRDGTRAASPPRAGSPPRQGRSIRFCSHCGAPLPAPPPVTCGTCETSHWLDAKPCAGALVTRDGRLLLVRRAHEPWHGLWDIPGGFCGPREHPEAAAAREVREETGLTVRVGRVLGMWMDSYAADGPDADKATLNIYFHATVEGAAAPTANPNEVAEIAWFLPQDLPRELAFPGHVPTVLRAWREARLGLDRDRSS